MVMVNIYGKLVDLGTCRTWMALVRPQAYHCLCLMGDLDAGYPYKHTRRQPDWIQRRGSAPYGTDPMRIWDPHKKFPNPDSRIRIRRHSPLVWYDSRIRTTSGSGIVCIFCFDEFFTDPDPRIRIRVRVTPNSFRKILNMIF